jgi:2-C-methyl-D-erythritol 4-phosphate cytidylyltransferase
MFSMPQMNLIGQEITDESMLVEPLGPVDLVEGHPRNIKITQPEDIALAELILKRNPEFKIRKPR